LYSAGRLGAELELRGPGGTAAELIARRKAGSFRQNNGWYSRGLLPHVDGEDLCQFVTFRLYDSLPRRALYQLEQELSSLAPEELLIQKRKRIEHLIDAGLGKCYLARPEIAVLVQQVIHHFHGSRYTLHSWVIMPNHIHLLITVCSGNTLSKVMQSLKSFSARRANQILGATGPFWYPEYYDRYIRDPQHLKAVVSYIDANPVKARLCARPEDWRFGSAGYLISGAEPPGIETAGTAELQLRS